MTAAELPARARQCQVCGKVHEKRPGCGVPGHGMTRPGPEDGHSYRTLVSLEVIAAFEQLAGTG